MEERGFTVLLERIEQQYQLLSEKVGSLDEKIDRGLQGIEDTVDRRFDDLQTGISKIVKDINALKHHSHSRGSDV